MLCESYLFRFSNVALVQRVWWYAVRIVSFSFLKRNFSATCVAACCANRIFFVSLLQRGTRNRISECIVYNIVLANRIPRCISWKADGAIHIRRRFFCETLCTPDLQTGVNHIRGCGCKNVIRLDHIRGCECIRWTIASHVCVCKYIWASTCCITCWFESASRETLGITIHRDDARVHLGERSFDEGGS